MINKQTVKIWITTIFLITLLGTEVMLFVFAWNNSGSRGVIHDVEVVDLWVIQKKILEIYSVPIASILASFFVEGKGTTKKVRHSVSLLAVVVSFAWNAAVAYHVARLAWGDQVIDFKDTLTQIEGVAQSTNFLIVGMLTYFFLSGSSASPKSTNDKIG